MIITLTFWVCLTGTECTASTAPFPAHSFDLRGTITAGTYKDAQTTQSRGGRNG